MVNKPAGTHDFSGEWAPASGAQALARSESFSVGVFQWVARAGNDRLTKRGAVKVRVRGSTSNPQRVTDKAHEIVAALDAGTYRGPKTVNV